MWQAKEGQNGSSYETAWAVCRWEAGAAGVGDLWGGGDLGRREGAAWLALEIPPQALFGSFPVPETQPRYTLIIWRAGSCVEKWFSTPAACQNHLESFFNSRCLAPPQPPESDTLQVASRQLWLQSSPVDSRAQLV